MNLNLRQIVAGLLIVVVAGIGVRAQLRLPQTLPANPGGATLSSQYTGTIGWTWHVQGPHGQTTETMSASIINGKVACNGAHDQSDENGAEHVALNGPGLFTITFGTQRGRSYYVFEVACPSIDHRTEGNWADSHSSYKQLGKLGTSLTGTWTNGGDDPALGDASGGAADPFDSTTDAVNGVTETTKMVWELLHKL